MSHGYFNKLNYTLANEDTELEFSLLPENSNHVLAIAGSGSRILPLFAKGPKKISICDFSHEQLALTELRIQTVKSLTYKEFLGFWGYEDLASNKRQEYFESLNVSKEFQKTLKNILTSTNFEGLIYKGKYERMLIKFQSIIKFILGKEINSLEKIEDLNEFHVYLKHRFPKLKWKLLVSILGNSTLFNAFLYKGSHPKKNIKISYRKYYFDIFQKLFKFLIPKESFFLQMIFFGKVKFIQGAPFETSEILFEKMKTGINKSHINFYQGDLFSTLKRINDPISFLSFSDILSYFPEEIEKNYMQTIKMKLAPKAITVNRYYLRVHNELDLAGYKNITNDHLDLLNKEKTQIYQILIYERQND